MAIARPAIPTSFLYSPDDQPSVDRDRRFAFPGSGL
jgi:hypothetical protein